MGPGRTGVKGVIRDRDEAVALSRAQRAREVDAMNRAMERASLGGKTYLEEERERAMTMTKGGEWEKEALEGGSLFAMGMGSGMVGRMVDGVKRGRFGHLREVGEKGYVNAVEGEKGDVWVVVHIYESVSSSLSFLELAGGIMCGESVSLAFWRRVLPVLSTVVIIRELGMRTAETNSY